MKYIVNAVNRFPWKRSKQPYLYTKLIQYWLCVLYDFHGVFEVLRIL